MDPDQFLASESAVTQLLRILYQFYTNEVDTPKERNALLITAGIDENFRMRLVGNNTPNAYATILVGALRQFKVSDNNLDYHPLINLIGHLLELHSKIFSDREEVFLTSLYEKGIDNLKAIRIRTAVGRIESPLGTAIGSGVLVGNDRLLTCYHVLTKDRPIQQAWVRFGYYNSNEPPLDAIPLIIRYDSQDQLNLDSQDTGLDYALVRLSTSQPKRALKMEHVSPRPLNKEWTVYLVHHPQGRPTAISEGKITALRRENSVVCHSAPGEPRSSGGALLDEEWRMVALHRGNEGILAGGCDDCLAAVPLEKFWQRIQPHL